MTLLDPHRPVEFLKTVLGALGYAIAIVALVTGFSNGQWPFPGGDVVDFYAPAGQALREGGSVYFPGFLYGPPWAVAFAGLSWLGPAAIHAVVLALDAVALWVIADRDFRRLGFILWFPLVWFELAAGQLNLLIAAAIVLAQRGVMWPLAAMSLAKVWPAVAIRIDRRDLRGFVIWLVTFSLVSLPWLFLWPQWIAALIDTSAAPRGPVVPVPFLVRLPFVILFAAIQRPWSRALAAAISSPGLYWGQLVVLVAPVTLWFRERRERSDALHASSTEPAA
jgi:hypothetical protein